MKKIYGVKAFYMDGESDFSVLLFTSFDKEYCKRKVKVLENTNQRAVEEYNQLIKEWKMPSYKEWDAILKEKYGLPHSIHGDGVEYAVFETYVISNEDEYKELSIDDLEAF